MSKTFIKIVGRTKSKNKLEESISQALLQLDQTLWADRDHAKFIVFQLFDEVVAAYQGKCTAARPTSADHGNSFTFWVCDMLTIALYDVEGYYFFGDSTFSLEYFDTDLKGTPVERFEDAYKNHLNTIG
ncbi:hypothetical protein [Flavobacterium psychrotrophum]|uniref:hypothetical protein n=1 Tax=Flavobacterium psychrotrophum TaxID=2294119 RepID=UPI0013C4D0D3|nr:hypothetical protein [Flavobacterium psychrotrophum]